MEGKKGYIVLEAGFEYDDESYSVGNYGPTYEQPKKCLLIKKKRLFFGKNKAWKN